MNLKKYLSLVTLVLASTFTPYAQSQFASQSEVAEYLEGEWQVDVVRGGFAGGIHYLPSPFYYDSSTHKVIFEVTEIDSTPLFCRAYINDTLFQETFVSITQNPSQIILPRWLLQNLPYNLEVNAGLMETMGFYGFSPDTTVLGGNIAADGFEFGLSRPITSNVQTPSDLETVHIFPNPVKDVIFVTGVQDDTPYQIYNLNGQLLNKGLVRNNTIEPLPFKGIIILNLYTHETWVVKKIIMVD